MKVIYFLLTCLSFNAFATLCGDPEYLDKVPVNSVVFIGKYTSVKFKNDLTLNEHVTRDELARANKVAILLFTEVTMLKGEARNSAHVKFLTDGGMNNWFPKPPIKLGTYYLFSFEATGEDGSVEKPFFVGPCNLFKRV